MHAHVYERVCARAYVCVCVYQCLNYEENMRDLRGLFRKEEDSHAYSTHIFLGYKKTAFCLISN